MSHYDAWLPQKQEEVTALRYRLVEAEWEVERLEGDQAILRDGGTPPTVDVVLDAAWTEGILERLVRLRRKPVHAGYSVEYHPNFKVEADIRLLEGGRVEEESLCVAVGLGEIIRLIDHAEERMVWSGHLVKKGVATAVQEAALCSGALERLRDARTKLRQMDVERRTREANAGDSLK